ncbi:MAG: T9SS type A sorting domain-containing protein [Flavobacteriales bacterium]
MQAILLAACTGMAQQPFDLDTTFRTQIDTWNVFDLLPLEDGDVVVSGNIKFPGDIEFRGGARLNPDGIMDDVNFPVAYLNGKMVPWGTKFYGGSGPGVRRVNADWTLDDTFGMISSPYFSAFQGGDFHVFPDGRILMSGSHYLDDTARGFVGSYELIWFSNTGYLDTTRIHRNANGTIFRFKQLPNDQFICAGYCTMFEGVPVGRIFKVNADGAVDPSFQTGVYTGLAFGYHPLADGRVIVVGKFQITGDPDTLHVVRFLADGSLDPTFNNHLAYLRSPALSFGYGATISGIHAIDEDHLLVFGNFEHVDGQPRKGICMIKATGELDTEYFNDAGCGNYNYMGVNYASIEGVVQAPDSSWYVWGAYHGYDDGTTNDTLQRMVSHLYPADIAMGAQGKPFGGLRATMLVYPNPTSGNATLQLDALPRNATLVVRDALGRAVQRRSVTDHYTTLALPGSGVYMVEVWDAQQRLATERVVVE